MNLPPETLLVGAGITANAIRSLLTHREPTAQATFAAMRDYTLNVASQVEHHLSSLQLTDADVARLTPELLLHVDDGSPTTAGEALIALERSFALALSLVIVHQPVPIEVDDAPAVLELRDYLIDPGTGRRPLGEVLDQVIELSGGLVITEASVGSLRIIA